MADTKAFIDLDLISTFYIVYQLYQNIQVAISIFLRVITNIFYS